MTWKEVVALQTRFNGDLESLSEMLCLELAFYEADRDEEGDYEYITGKLMGEMIELNRRMGDQILLIFPHNAPPVFSHEVLSQIRANLTERAVPVIAYQTLQDLKSGRMTIVA